MNEWQLYRLDDGTFTGRSVACSDLAQLLGNVPSDCGCIMGEFDHLSQKVDMTTGDVIDYIPPQPSINHVWNSETKRWLYVKTDNDIAAEVRDLRNTMIREYDWTQLPDVPPATKTLWAVYRQALRDITKQSNFPRTVTWPTIPEKE